MRNLKNLKKEKLNSREIESMIKNNEVDLVALFIYQNVTEKIIEKYKNKYADLEWEIICRNQKLSISFIERNKDKISWLDISAYQELNEKFIEKHLENLNIPYIMKFQKLSERFIKKYYDLLFSSLYLRKDSWHYKTKKEKKDEIVKLKEYECYKNYFIAFKLVRENRLPLFNSKFKYNKRGIYKTWADTSSNENGFGFSCGSYNYIEEIKNKINHIKTQTVRVKIKYEDVARILENGRKLRVFKIKVLD